MWSWQEGLRLSDIPRVEGHQTCVRER
jgi:hypothetical protein